MKRLPLGIQSFRKIIEGDYVYVDKTRYVYELINGASYNFLSRPRRFGKSLLLDTIEEVFNGDKRLFEGLWIHSSDYDFTKHPVIRLDMSSVSSENPDTLKTSIASALKRRIQKENLDISDDIPSDLFIYLIEGLYNKYSQKVVILIDEYDKPILDHIANVEIAEANRQVIKNFCGILKSMDPCLRFSLITGVSKFTKTSIFSELNNLFDITFSYKFPGICGIEINDLNEYFNSHIEHLSTVDGLQNTGSIYDQILNWYDGYSWDGKTRVINPFSLLNFLEHRRFGSYWYASGTPSFLIRMLKEAPASYLSLKNLKIIERSLENPDLRKMEVEPLLFQAGYLTVKETLHTSGAPVYALDIPNMEVREAFNMQIVAAFTENGDIAVEQTQMQLLDALRSSDMQKTLGLLRRLFASIPYNLHIDREAYYHSIFFAIMTVLGFDIDMEVSVSGGKVDAVLELPEVVYVIEFKYADCPRDAGAEEKAKLFKLSLDEAMAQISNKKYSAKYIGTGKPVHHVAFAFLGRGDIELRAELLKPLL
ncbi:MAG: ATP-binding protein [Oscillospiraceae bacterium]|nr:ATP-binding protein [Oscillospiraceae bacterium]